MVRYESDGVFDAPLEKVWQILEEHGDPEKVREHHPSILDVEIVDEGEGWIVAIETFDTPEGPMPIKIRSEFDPPEGWDSEFLSGPFEGATTTHTYSEEAGGRTRVKLVGDFPVPEGMSEEEVLGMVDDLYTTAFHEDQRALKRL